MNKAFDAASFEERAEMLRDHVAAQGFMRLVGAELESITPGACVLSVARRPEVLQQYGMFHGGVTAFLIDNGTTLAACTLVAPGQGGLTAEYKLNLLAPAVGDRLVCRARVLRPGKTLSVVTADVYSVTNGTEKHCATALATIAIVDLGGLPPVPKRG
jgi:uncharacterized protein (TIGR00369 family)